MRTSRGPQAFLPGFLAVARRSGAANADAVAFDHWGLASVDGASSTFLLTRVVRDARGAVDPAEIARSMVCEPSRLTRLLPPFAAVTASDEHVIVVADSMGFRQIYLSEIAAPGIAVLSTSALAAARARGAGCDDSAAAVQSLLGWQLGQRTMFTNIVKLEPGGIAELSAKGIRVDARTRRDPVGGTFADAVREAATLLRASLEVLLDDYPDAVLQLTGGQDSRILLSAIPPARRKGLRAMTLGLPGSADVTVAKQIAGRYGLSHEVRGLADLAALHPGEAWQLCTQAARRVDGMSDPLALAALGVAESQFEQGVRISGLGGEVARGFYYMGRVRDRSYTQADAQRLADWRMFANESVEPGALRPEFAEWARARAHDAVAEALIGGGSEWFRATDNLYLRHRMQRWAGVTDTAVAFDRIVLNPMLDESFLALAMRLRPEDKADSRFLAALQMELDPDLGSMPLEGRPAPRVYANPGLRTTMTRAATTTRKTVKKIVQRVARGNRAPAGGQLVAEKIVEHWRANPEIVESPVVQNYFDPRWLHAMLESQVAPRPSTAAFLTNLITLHEGLKERRAGQ